MFMIGLAVFLCLLYAFTHNGFMETGRLLDDFIAYSGLDRLAALNPNQENWQPQKIAAASAEAQSPEQTTPTIVTNVTKTPSLPVEPIAPLRGVIHSWPSAGKMVALTFDDGPSKQFTPQYLKVLNEYGVHATFFLIGRQVQENPGLAAMIAGSGNEIGSHTFDHHNLKQMSLEAAEQDITSAQQLIEQDTHQPAFLFRPPGGNLNEPLVKIIDKMGLQVILWNIDPRDWDESSSTEHTIDNVLTNLQPGSIILLHEGKQHTLTALPTLIEDLRQRGYQLVTVSELLAPQGTAQPEPQPEPQAPPKQQPEPQTSPQQTRTLPPPEQPQTPSQPQVGPPALPSPAPLPALSSVPASQNMPNPQPQPIQPVQ